MTSWLNSLLGAPSAPDAPVSALIGRIKGGKGDEQARSAEQLAKRVQQTRSNDILSDIGNAVPELFGVIGVNKSNGEVVPYLLETMRHALLPSPSDSLVVLETIGRGVDRLVSDSGRMLLLLSLLEENDRAIQFETAKLLTVLLAAKPSEVQQGLLQSPVGIPRLVDLLEGPEMIRNEGLLLLRELTGSNHELGKILVFSGALEILFDIMNEEGGAEGGIVVIDCLQVVANLLRETPLNISHFRFPVHLHGSHPCSENGCIARLAPLLRLEASDVWMLADEKADIFLLTLSITSLLVSVSNPQETYRSQSLLLDHGISALVLALALGGLTAPRVRMAALSTLALLLKGHADTCAYFTSATLITLKRSEPQSAFVRALSVSISAQTDKERRLAINVIQSYLRDNESAQTSLGAALSDQVEFTEFGGEREALLELLDVLVTWTPSSEESSKVHSACLVLAALVGGCAASKTALFGVQVTSIPPSESLGVRALRLFTQAVRVKTPNGLLVAFLRFIVSWFADSPLGVSAFLQVSSLSELCSEVVASPSSNVHVAGLVGLLFGMVLLSQSDSSQPFPVLLDKTVGVKKLNEVLAAVVRSDDFQAAESTRGKPGDDKSVLFDYDFTLFFRHRQQVLLAAIENPPSSGSGLGVQQNEGEFLKGIIRQQDERLREYETRVTELQRELATKNTVNAPPGTSKDVVEHMQYQADQLRQREQLIATLKVKLTRMEHNKVKLSHNSNPEFLALRAENKELKNDTEHLKNKTKTLKQKLQLADEQNVELQTKLMQLQRVKAEGDYGINGHLLQYQQRIAELEAALQQAQTQCASTQAELEELFVVLADQSEQIRGYRRKLNLPDEEGEDTADFT